MDASYSPEFIVSRHPLYEGVMAALGDKSDKAGLSGAQRDLSKMWDDYHAHDFGADERNERHWQSEGLHHLNDVLNDAVNAPILDMGQELRKDAEFRAMQQESGNGNYEAMSWANIWLNGRHGRGHEL